MHRLRNLIAHASKKLHEELTADYSAMIYADTPALVLARRQAFLRKWRLRCPEVARSLEEVGERQFTFLRYPPAQWRSIRTINATERLHEEFKRPIKAQCALPCADTAYMMFWALLASGHFFSNTLWDCMDPPERRKTHNSMTSCVLAPALDYAPSTLTCGPSNRHLDMQK